MIIIGMSRLENNAPQVKTPLMYKSHLQIVWSWSFRSQENQRQSQQQQSAKLSGVSEKQRKASTHPSTGSAHFSQNRGYPLGVTESWKQVSLCAAAVTSRRAFRRLKGSKSGLIECN